MLQSIADFHLYCFGGFYFTANDKKPIHFGTKKARALLCYLALETPRSFRRRFLAGLLWSECTEERALHNLRQTLYQLKNEWAKVTKHHPLFTIVQDTIAINPDIPLWVDVLAFEAAHQQAFEHFKNTEHMDQLDIHQLMKAVALFTGPFLDRFRLTDTPLFNEWTSFQRERTTQKAVEGFNFLADYYERRGEYARAGHLANRVIELNPWDESAYAHGMRLDALGKQWETASRKYHQLKKNLKVNLSIDPQPSVTAIFQQIQTIALNNESFPPKYPPEVHFLPHFSTAFIGRENEISEISGMIANPTIRLVSLVGVGGIGKTRLANEIGQMCRGLFRHGVYFISIKDVSSSEALLHHIGTVLKYTFSRKADHRDQLLNYMREKHSLLIIDGCEDQNLHHFISILVFDLLITAPGIMILTTTRARLGLHQEHVLHIQGLDHQSWKCTNTVLSQDKPEAVALFIERAKQANPQIEYSENDLSHLFDLCHQVEGHPLSIELLASATPMHTINDLISDFSGKKLPLETVLNHLSPENSSLSIVLEKSWQSLSEDQQKALCILSSFKGGFTEQAACQVAELSEEKFNNLLEKSFLQILDLNRYDIHDVIHQFAVNKAAEYHLSNITQVDYVNYFRGQMANIVESFYHGNQLQALDTIEADLENLITSWQYYVDQQEIIKLENFIEIFYQFFNIRSRFNEGMTLFQETIRAASYLDPFDPLMGKLDIRLAYLALRVHQNDMAFQLFVRSLAILKDKEDLHELGLAYLGLGNYYIRIKDFDHAMENAELGLSCFTKLGDTRLHGRVIHLMGMIYQRSGDYPTAKQIFLKALALSREANDQRGILLRLNQLAGHACNDGDYETAEKYYLEILQLSRSFKDRFQEAIILNNLASIYHPREEYQLEESVLMQSLDICKEIGDRDGEAIALSNLGELANTQGNFHRAIEYGKEALEIAVNLGEEWTLVVVYDILGCAYTGASLTQTALQCFNRAIQIAYKINAWDLLTRCVVNLAETCIHKEDETRAITLLQAALSHPSILFEFSFKAKSLLMKLGISPPETTNQAILIDALENHFNISCPEENV